MTTTSKLPGSSSALWALAEAEASTEHARRVEMLRITRPFTYDSEARVEEQARTAKACQQYGGLLHDTHKSHAANLDNTDAP